MPNPIDSSEWVALITKVSVSDEKWYFHFCDMKGIILQTFPNFISDYDIEVIFIHLKSESQ